MFPDMILGSDGNCYLKSTVKIDPTYYTWFLSAVSPIEGNLSNQQDAVTRDELIKGPIPLDSPQSCINLCQQTQNCLFVNFQITNPTTATVDCYLKKGYGARGFQSSLGFSMVGSGGILQPAGVTTVVPSPVPSNTASFSTSSISGSGGTVVNTDSTTGGSATPTNGGSGNNGGNGNGNNGGIGSGNPGIGGGSNSNGTSSSSNNNSFPVVAVAGGAGVGGIILGAGIVAGGLLYRRRRYRNGNGGNEFGGESGVGSSKVIVDARSQGSVAFGEGQLSDLQQVDNIDQTIQQSSTSCDQINNSNNNNSSSTTPQLDSTDSKGNSIFSLIAVASASDESMPYKEDSVSSSSGNAGHADKGHWLDIGFKKGNSSTSLWDVDNSFAGDEKAIYDANNNPPTERERAVSNQTTAHQDVDV
ncbi:hypothetical protein HDU76_006901 [Blyttiomyces sp. JEL0837]|nr:hypothetical protein HDU76_006901 [Blyttiomyces sp. JEL0837]